MSARRRRPRNNNDEWLEGLLALGIGALAIAFLAKLAQGPQDVRTCPYCGTQIHKWSRLCPNCRNNLYL